MDLRHAIMEDLTHGFQRPNIIDVKVSDTYHFNA
jgi:hypothetical protein